MNVMKIYFVRHGHPDYKNDSLTELGKKQARAAAERLKDSGIERIYSSSCGRAFQTAEYTAKQFGLKVIPCDFIRELGWGSINGEPIYGNGQPWIVADSFVKGGKSVALKEWADSEAFHNNSLVGCVKTVTEGLDRWLASLGYEREGEYYRVTENVAYKTVAMFSHAGASSAAMAHLLNIPFPQFCEILDVYYTSVTVIDLFGEAGELISPKIRILNDSRHIDNIPIENVYGN